METKATRQLSRIIVPGLVGAFIWLLPFATLYWFRLLRPRMFGLLFTTLLVGAVILGAAAGATGRRRPCAILGGLLLVAMFLVLIRWGRFPLGVLVIPALVGAALGWLSAVAGGSLRARLELLDL